jgi:hypothetical protein
MKKRGTLEGIVAAVVAVAMWSCGRTNFGTADSSSSNANANTAYAFVTAEAFTGDLGGLVGADQKCNSAASAVGLRGSGNYRALLGTALASNAVGRIEMGQGWQTTDGTSVANVRADFASGQLLNPVNVAENKVRFSKDAEVWGGNSQSNCADWTMVSGGLGMIGFVETVFPLENPSSLGCERRAHLLCVETGATTTVALTRGPQKIMFVSSGKFAMSPQGRAAADELCRVEATNAALPGTYLAVLGTSTEAAIARFDANAVYQRTDGAIIGSLSEPARTFVNRGANQLNVINERVRTGQAPNVVATAHCDNWTNAAGEGGLGVSSKSGNRTRYEYQDVCSPAAVYCAQP